MGKTAGDMSCVENGEAREATPPLSDGETRRLSLARWGDALELL